MSDTPTLDSEYWEKKVAKDTGFYKPLPVNHEQKRRRNLIKFAKNHGFDAKAADNPKSGEFAYHANVGSTYVKGIPPPPLEQIPVYVLAQLYLSRNKIPIPIELQRPTRSYPLSDSHGAAESSAPPRESDDFDLGEIDEALEASVKPSTPPFEPSAPPRESDEGTSDFPPDHIDEALKVSAEEATYSPFIKRLIAKFRDNKIPEDIIPYLLLFRTKIQPTPDVDQLMTQVYPESKYLHELTGYQYDNEKIFEELIKAKGDVNAAANSLAKGGKRTRKTRVRNTKGRKTRVRNTKGRKTRVRNTKGRKMTKRNRR